MTEKEIVTYLEELAADEGMPGARLVIENVPEKPCSVYIFKTGDRSRTEAGFGETFEQAFDMIRLARIAHRKERG